MSSNQKQSSITTTRPKTTTATGTCVLGRVEDISSLVSCGYALYCLLVCPCTVYGISHSLNHKRRLSLPSGYPGTVYGISHSLNHKRRLSLPSGLLGTYGVSHSLNHKRRLSLPSGLLCTVYVYFTFFYCFLGSHCFVWVQFPTN